MDPSSDTRDPQESEITQNDDSNELLLTRSLERCARLVQTDEELRRALPSPAALEKIRSRHTTIECVATAFELYADRPCVGHRPLDTAATAADGGSAPRYLPEFRAVSYADVWSRVEAFASGLQHEKLANTGDFVGISGFGSTDWVVAGLACMYLSAVSVPLQTDLPPADLELIVTEAELACVICSVGQLARIEDVLPRCPSVRSIVVMDLLEGDRCGQSELERARRALRPLEARGRRLAVRAMHEVERLGRQQGIAPKVLPAQRGEPDPLMTLMYTSGSTGSPKGAMIPESLWHRYWQLAFTRSQDPRLDLLPHVGLNYSPMNHFIGRSQVGRSLMRGGITHFVLKSDMSTLFEDIRLARPTTLFLVPRIAELIHQQFQAEVLRRARGLGAGGDDAARRRIEREIMAEMRGSLLGDRLLLASIGSAPTPPEVFSFLKRCFDVPVFEGYGSTEASSLTTDGRLDRELVTEFKLVDVPELGYSAADQPYPRGELHIRSSLMVPGYYKNEKATRALFDEEGLMNTGDIVEQRGPDTVVWIDRARNVLKLSQGEFVATSRLEALYSAGSPFIQQIFLYGNSTRSYLLAVVVPEMREISAHLRQRDVKPDGEPVRQLLRAEIDRIARENQLRGYEIPRDFLIEPAPFTRASGLLTETQKPARARLKARYSARLEALYATIERTQLEELRSLREGGATPASAALVVKKALEATLGITGVEPRSARSFAQLGGDSLSAVRLSRLIEEISGVAVPVGLVLNPTSSVRAIADHLEHALAGEAPRRAARFDEVHGAGAEVVRAADLRLDRFLGPDELAAARRATPAAALPAQARVALLTGANGFLGRFLALELLERLPEEGRLYCVVRSPDDALAFDRLRATYESDPALLERFDALSAHGRLVVLAGDLVEPRFGLADDLYAHLCVEVDCVVHNGALVNHALSYPQLFEPNVLGTVEAIRLSLAHRVKSMNYISTIAAVGGLDRSGPIREDEDIRELWPERALSAGYAVGYATSKWASEVLLQDAHDALGLPVNVYRPSGIMAHSLYRSQINVPDFFTRLLCGVVYTGLAPRSFYEGGRPHRDGHYDGLPVDAVARSIAAVAVDRRPRTGTVAVDQRPPTGGEGERASRATYHVVNPYWDDGISLDVIVSWVRSAGYPVERVDDYAAWYAAFRDRLMQLSEPLRRHSPLPILNAWERPARADGEVFDAERLLARLRQLAARGGGGDLATLPHVSEPLIHKYLDDMVALGLIGPAAVRAAS
ncbi:thioester reductase domain-containing protein [Sorangium sp. So ce394]|uniref:thioester reductase domain-containing protein n=1 Tax=Sorangium sp. So ce394 TaxID=3133310 RepID=UPI003F5BA44B